MELASRFRDHDLSDAYISVRLIDSASEGSESATENAELDKFPAHLVVLTQSPYFESQVSFNRQQRQQSGIDSSLNEDELHSHWPASAHARKRRRVENSSENQTLQIESTAVAQVSDDMNVLEGKPTLVLSIGQKAGHTAAGAVIATLYGVKGALCSLQPVELVHAVRYADMLQVETAVSMAVDLLRPHAAAAGGLGLDTLAELAALPSWPDRMLSLLPDIAKLATNPSNQDLAPAAASSVDVAATAASDINTLVQQILVNTLGHLEAVWRRKELSSMLLQLPSPAVIQLISSSKLSVYSEDTVLYTVEKYLQKQNSSNQSALRSELSKLIRAPYLSHLQLSSQTYVCTQPSESSCSETPLLGQDQGLLQRLQMLRRLELSPEKLQQVLSSWSMPEAPRSWVQGPRRVLHESEEGVSLVWHLLVGDLQKAAINAYNSRTSEVLKCPEVSAPLGGFEWSLRVQRSWQTSADAVRIDVYYSPVDMAPGLHYGIQYGIKFVPDGPHGNDFTSRRDAAKVGDHRGRGYKDFFGLGAMVSGWDEPAWAAKGLPSEGSIGPSNASL